MGAHPLTRWEKLQRWDIHRIRRALQRAIEIDDGSPIARAQRNVALWRDLDERLERMLKLDQSRYLPIRRTRRV